MIELLALGLLLAVYGGLAAHVLGRRDAVEKDSGRDHRE